MHYVDGFLLVVPKKNLATYRRIAEKAGKIWLKYGALQYVETAGDDMKSAKKWGMKIFPEVAKAKPSEAVVFSFIVYKSRKHRDQVNAKVMKDPAMNPDDMPMPFDMKKMAVGGFNAIVDM